MSKQARIGVSLEIDNLKDIEKQLNSLTDNVLSMDIDSKDAKSIEKLRQTVERLELSVEALSKGKLNTKTFENVTNQIKTMSSDIIGLEKGLKSVIEKLGDKGFSKEFEQVVRDAKTANVAVNNMIQTTNAIYNAAKKVNDEGIRPVSSADIKNAEKLRSLLKEIKDSSKSKTEVIAQGKDESLLDYLNRLLEIAKKAQSEIDKLNIARNNIEDPSSFEAFSIDKQTQSMYKSLDKIYATIEKHIEKENDAGNDLLQKSLTKKLGVDNVLVYLSEVRDNVDKELGYILEDVQGKLDEINVLLAGKQKQQPKVKVESKIPTDSEVKRGSDGKIAVPVYPTQSPNFDKQLQSIIDIAQDYALKNPIKLKPEVEVKFLSPYLTSKNQRVLEEIKEGLENVESEEIKNKVAELLAVIDRELNPEVNIKVNVSTRQAYAKINYAIEAIQQQLNRTRLVLSPELEFSKITNEKIQEETQKALSRQKIVENFDYLNTLFEQGKKIDSSLAKGMADNLNIVEETSKDVAETVETEIRDGLDTHSPSKKTEEIGKNVDQGLAKGISENTEVIKSAIDEVNKIIIFDGVKENIYDVTKDFDLIISKLQELAEKMSLPVFHSGFLDKGLLNSKNFEPSDNFYTMLNGNYPDAPGSGVFVSQNALNVKERHNGNFSDAKHTDNLHLYAMDMAKYVDQMYTFANSDTLTDYLYVVETLTKSLKDFLKDGTKIDTDSIYNSYKDWFNSFKITTEQLNQFMSEMADYGNSIKNSPTKMKRSGNLANAFAQRFLGAKGGIDVSRTLQEDSDSVGNVLFKLDTTHPFDIDFGNNQNLYDYFYHLVREKILEGKAKTSNNSVDQILFEYMVGDKDVDITPEFKKKLEDAVSNIPQVVESELNKSLSSNDNSFKSVGGYFPKGLAEGISENISIVEDASSKMAKAAIETVKEETDTHSPSKVAEQLGKWFDEGYAEGITGGADKVADAISEMIQNNVLKLNDLTGFNIPGAEQGIEFFDEIKAGIDAYVSGLKPEFQNLYKNLDNLTQMWYAMKQIADNLDYSDVPATKQIVKNLGSYYSVYQENGGHNNFLDLFPADKIKKLEKIINSSDSIVEKIKTDAKNIEEAISDVVESTKTSDKEVHKALVEELVAKEKQLEEAGSNYKEDVETITKANESLTESADKVEIKLNKLNIPNLLKYGDSFSTRHQNTYFDSLLSSLPQVETEIKQVSEKTKETTKDFVDLDKAIKDVGENKKISKSPTEKATIDSEKADELVDDLNEALKIDKERVSVHNQEYKINQQIAKQTESYYEYYLKYGNKMEELLKSAISNPFGNTKEYTAEYKKQLEDAESELVRFQGLLSTHKDGKIFTFDDIARLDEFKDKIDKATKGLKDQNNVIMKSENLLKLYKKVNKDLNDNTAMPTKLRNEYEELQTTLRKIIESGEEISAVYGRQLTNDFLRLSSTLEATGRTGNSLFRLITKAGKSQTAQLIARYFSLQDLIRYARQAFDTVRELDTALIDLRKTTSMSGQELEDFYYDSNEVARSLGVTTRAIIEQAAQWSRLGYSSKEASIEMAKLSSQFASISPGMETADAQTGLVSIMKAWDVSTDNVEREIMDTINVLGKQNCPNT